MSKRQLLFLAFGIAREGVARRERRPIISLHNCTYPARLSQRKVYLKNRGAEPTDPVCAVPFTSSHALVSEDNFRSTTRVKTGRKERQSLLPAAVMLHDVAMLDRATLPANPSARLPPLSRSYI